MNINMKYYIVTICAIFVALGVGILVGFNLNYDQALTKQQSEVLESFNTEFDTLKDKNKTLQSEIENLNNNINDIKSYVNRNMNVLTQDMLTDKNTGIILTSENHDYSEDIETVINNANGNLSFNIIIKDNINDNEKLTELSKGLNMTFKSSNDVIKYIVNSLTDAKGYDQLHALEELGVIKINSIDESKYQDFDSVVLLGELTGKDAKDKFEVKEKLLVDSLKEKNKYLVAATQSDIDTTILKLYSENDISTIDNINEGIGKVSLTTLLKNQNIVGNYGQSELAKEIMAYKNN
ncbi:copper transporter [Terrisporobacter sp.]|uniref:copper transporter n=1 Tax=Terrisporobacter sp. TaxID=1965305 RepID=UPI00262E1786|nr:copper transporter [Terrisporobacter sp.]